MPFAKTGERPKRPDVNTMDKAIDVEVDAFLTRMDGLSSGGIVQALADMGKGSTWFASELARMYEETSEPYYRSKLLSMMFDLVKQKEGQRITVESDMAGASDEQLLQLEVSISEQITNLLKEKSGEQARIVEIEDTNTRETRTLPETICIDPARRKARKGKKKRRDTTPIPTDASAKKVPRKSGANPRTKRRKQKRKDD